MDKYLLTLWISRWLSLNEIKKAYLKKAMDYHPDRNHGFKKEATEKMIEINFAWEYIREHFNEYQNLGYSKVTKESSIKQEEAEDIDYGNEIDEGPITYTNADKITIIILFILIIILVILRAQMGSY